MGNMGGAMERVDGEAEEGQGEAVQAWRGQGWQPQLSPHPIPPQRDNVGYV